MNLYIGNLDYSIREEQLREMFEEFGEVSSAKVITDKFSGRSKGYGFVEMPNDGEGEAAIAALNGKSIKERALSVTQARPKTEGGFQNNRSRR
ncbi:MAG: RNA-binding protein [Bacteroidetes bacterium HGW-Bacteroidetes-21]|jgi:RNA recognition motif-containing protein|nr:MAG: RNA-binding protein [Bacteroidetes bacterium HGW-Bacteroidetes-21]